MKDNWHYDTDPHGCIANGELIDKGKAKVVGFSAPAGNSPSRLMVTVEYLDGTQTTRDYASILVQKIKGGE